MSFASQNPTYGQWLRPRHPDGKQRQIAPPFLGVCYPLLRTRFRAEPIACGDQRIRSGRIAFAAGCRSLHTPFGLLPADVWLRR